MFGRKPLAAGRAEGESENVCVRHQECTNQNGGAELQSGPWSGPDRGPWQNKAECHTATTPAWQAPRFPSSLCLWQLADLSLQRGLGGGGEEGLVVFLLSPHFAPSDITAAPIPDARRPKVFFPEFV